MTIAMPPCRIIGVPGDTSGDHDMTKRPYLFRASDLARMWGQERARAAARRADLTEAAAAVAAAAAKPVSLRTVYRYIQQSRTGMYVDNPMPMPHYPDEGPKQGQIPVWIPDEGETIAGLERRIRGWWHSRPGQGAGGGPRPGGKPAGARRVPPQTVPCWCGCGQRLAPGTLCDRMAGEDAAVRAKAQRVAELHDKVQRGTGSQTELADARRALGESLVGS